MGDAAKSVPDVERADIVRRYQERGQSARFIGFALSRSEGTVLKVLKEEGAKVERAHTKIRAGRRPFGAKKPI